MAADFGNNDYGGVDKNTYLGGYYEDEKQKNSKKNITPEISFQIDLLNAYDFLDSFIDESEFNLIKNSLDNFNHKLFKNPALILISFIVLKSSKTFSLEPQKIKAVYTNPNIIPILKINNISMYDIIRYCRYITLYNAIKL